MAEKDADLDLFNMHINLVQLAHKVSRNEIYRWMKSGKLEAVKKGQPAAWHFRADQVEALRLERIERLTITLARLAGSAYDYL